MADKIYKLTFKMSDGSTQNVEFTAPQGETGNAGQDGVSPIVDISKNGSTTTISITDVNGTQTAEISDGSSSSDSLYFGSTEPISGPALWLDTNLTVE